MRTFKILLLFSIALTLSLNSCKKSQEEATQLSENLSAYVYAYTSGVISKVAPIKVRFTQAVVEEERVGTVAKEILQINPSVAGQAVWQDAQTLVFKPQNNFKSNREYSASIDLKKLFSNLPKDFNTFRFDFQTRQQGIKVRVNQVSAVDNDDLRKQQVLGEIRTADVVNMTELEKALTARQGRKTLPVQLNNTGDLTHSFLISEVERGESASKVEIEWNGKAIGAENTGTEEIEVPALGDFSVTDAHLMQDNEQYILLNFSDPLQKNQDVSGLISVSNYNGGMRYVINGNQLRIYTNGRLTGERQVSAAVGIKNINGKRMPKASIWTLSFEDVKPAVRLVGKGVILPSSDGMVFPFEAVSLNAIEVEIFKIFDNNILQFLQTNELDGHYDLNRVGRIIYQGKVDLQQLGSEGISGNWTRYALDLDRFVEDDPQAIYQVRIGFRPEYSTFFCGGEEEEAIEELTSTLEEEKEEIKSFWDDYYGFGGYYNGYWNDRDDPCKDAYYNRDHFVRRNVLASNLGIIAKEGKDKSMLVSVSDLRTAQPISGVIVEFYDYQQQLLTSAPTDAAGTAIVQLKHKPFAVIAKNNKDRGYLKMQDGNALSLSRFNVAGAVTQKGLKGYLYGERGVWRPGDSIYLNFVIEDAVGKLPQNYPITFELRDARGQLQEKRTTSESIRNIYPLYTATTADAPTGNWTATVKAGGATFTKTLKVETVKPNRLKVDLDFGKEKLSPDDEPALANLNVKWLHGAPAQNLAAKVELSVNAVNTKFENFGDYEFDDPARKLESEPKTVFDGQLNTEGKATFTAQILGNGNQAPGRVRANFKSRAFENGGDFSTRNISLTYDPYQTYAGTFIPKNKYGEKRLDMNKSQTLDFAVVNKNGQAVGNQNLTVGLYRVEWRWWWDQNQDNVTRYNSSSHYDAIKTENLTTNSKGEATWNMQINDWGRYLVRVCDTKSGHCSGDFFYAGYPWYDDDGQNRQAAAMLTFSTDKDKYAVGETVQLSVPASAKGYAFISIEDGTKVLQSFWKETNAGDNIISIKTTPVMSPNVYAHVTLVQPHAQQDNDLPIRMYGVTSIMVEDPSTRLQPIVQMPKTLKPEQTFTIEVSEKQKQPMAYTIAVVDEGLLDLTNFKTPNPHESFYAKEALGVQTWDVYDYIIGGYGGELERILSIGGDGEVEIDPGKRNANRFKPVVMHLGPFFLNGGKAKHEIKMPNYVGSVRTMVVAANRKGAYGSAEATTPVKNPLMVLATLPRVLGTQETLKLPVTLFANDPKVKNVEVKIKESSGLVKINGNASKNVRFAKPGEEIVEFDLQVPQAIGIANFTITAKGNGETANQEIEIEIRNPNPFATDVQAVVLEANEQHIFNFDAIGIAGTNTGMLEVSNIPPIDLGRRMRYLIRYPHGCIEQTTSSVFPQLYVENLLELNEQQKENVPTNIKGGINRLKQFQTSDGGFAYWPGSENASTWGTNYGGHFLLEAQQRGYTVPASLLNRWKSFQQNRAKNWRRNSNRSNYYYYDYSELTQAYRLYTLALAKSPELGAMNRMREMDDLSVQAKWRLAAAYALAGKVEVAKELVDN